MSYAGPEPDRVRSAIAKLAKDDIGRIRELLERANGDWGGVLLLAEVEEEIDRNEASLGGMTVNERISHLKLFPAWDVAVAHKDHGSAVEILRRCRLSEDNIARVIESTF